MAETISFSNDSLVITKILDFLSLSTLDVINFGQVCQSFRRVCLDPFTKLSFSNYLSIIEVTDENNSNTEQNESLVMEKKYQQINCDASLGFLDYFTSIHLGCEFPAVDLDFVIDRVLMSPKVEELSLKNCEIYYLKNVNCKISRLECCDVNSNLKIDKLISLFPYLRHLKLENWSSISYHKELFEFTPKLQDLCERLESLSVIDTFTDLLKSSVQFSQLTELTFVLSKDPNITYLEYNDYYLDSKQFPKLKKLTLKVPSFCIQLDLPLLETLVLEEDIDSFDIRSMNSLLKLDNLKQLETSSMKLFKTKFLMAPNLENVIIRQDEKSIPLD